MLTMKPAKDSTNIAEQLKYLREYKHEFLRQGIVPIMMNILVEPLSRRGSARTPQVRRSPPRTCSLVTVTPTSHSYWYYSH